MEVEQVFPISSRSKQDRQLQDFPSIEKDELEAPPPPRKKGLNVAPLLRTSRRKALLILALTAVATGAAWYKSSKAPSLYQSSFRLLVEPLTSEAKLAAPTALTRSEGNVTNDKFFGLDYPTQISILMDTGMLSKIVEDVKTRYPAFNYGLLQSGLTVQRLGGKSRLNQTKLIEVTYQGYNAGLVEFVLERTADRYLKYSLEDRKSRLREGVKFIEDRLPELQQRVHTLAIEIQKLQEQYDLSDPKTKSEELINQVRDINLQQIEAERLLKEQKQLYESLQKQLALTPQEGLAASALSENANYQQLLSKYKDLESQIALESVRFQANSPQIQDLLSKRESLVSLLQAETNRITGQNLDNSKTNYQGLASQNNTRIALIKQMVDTANQIQVLEVRSQEVAKAKEKFEKQAKQFPAIARQYAELQRQLDLASRTLDQLMNQQQTLEIEATQNEVPWQLVSPPKIPRNSKGQPVALRNDPMKKLLIGMVGGLVLGLLIAILWEKYRNIFYTVKDVEDGTYLTLLGDITAWKGAGNLPISNSFADALEPVDTSQEATLFWEAFDTLYANLRFLFSDRPIRSLIVSSPTAGDGKSTVALNLAKTAAGMGQKVLLVDTDFRMPNQHNLLDLPNHKGLVDLLSSNQPTNSCIQHSVVVDNLFVLTAGQPLSNSIRQLASSQMQFLIKEFQASYDLVIYDTPHLDGLMDGHFLAAHTDGILMVVAVQKTPVSATKKVMQQLDTYGLSCLGVVANHLTKSVQKKPVQDKKKSPVDSKKDIAVSSSSSLL